MFLQTKQNKLRPNGGCSVSAQIQARQYRVPLAESSLSLRTGLLCHLERDAESMLAWLLCQEPLSHGGVNLWMSEGKAVMWNFLWEILSLWLKSASAVPRIVGWTLEHQLSGAQGWRLKVMVQAYTDSHPTALHKQPERCLHYLPAWLCKGKSYDPNSKS